MKRLLHWAVATLAVLGVAELALGLVLPPLTPRVFLDDPASPVLKLAPGANAEARMFGRAVTVSVDAGGRRTTPAAPPDGARVLHLVGDSQVFGWGLADDETLGARLQQSLGAGWQVRNHGVPGYGPSQYQQLLRQLPATDPVVLMLTEENDLWDSFDIARAGSYCGYMSDGWAPRWGLPCALLHSRLFQAAMAWRAQSTLTPTPIGFSQDSTVAAEVAASRLARWIAAERQRRDGRLLVAVVPWRGRFGETLRRAYFPPPDMPSREAYWPDDCGSRALFATAAEPAQLYLPNDSHVSAAGAQLLGRCVADALHQRVALVQPSTDR